MHVQTSSFFIGNGTKQGGILFPYLFTRYIRELLSVVSSSRIGYHIGGAAVNIFAYADDIVGLLLAPAWAAQQDLILLVSRCCQDLGLTSNVKKNLSV